MRKLKKELVKLTLEYEGLSTVVNIKVSALESRIRILSESINALKGTQTIWERLF